MTIKILNESGVRRKITQDLFNKASKFEDCGWPYLHLYATNESYWKISFWCEKEFGYENWCAIGPFWFFNDQEAKMLFALTWA